MGACIPVGPVQWKKDNGRDLVLLRTVAQKWKWIVYPAPSDKIEKASQKVHPNLKTDHIYLCISDEFLLSRSKIAGEIPFEGGGWGGVYMEHERNPSILLTHKNNGKSFLVVLNIWYEPKTLIALDTNTILTKGIELSPAAIMRYKTE